MYLLYTPFIFLLVLLLSSCSSQAALPDSAGIGPKPTLPQPDSSLIPTVNIAPAKPWQAGNQPKSIDGTHVVAFAKDLDHPRWLYILPNNDVLVAETNAPERPDDKSGIKGWVMGKVMQKAGASVPSADRITLLRDTDADGVADQRSVFLDGLHSPMGMALVDNDFYVANTDGIVKFRYNSGDMRISGPGTKLIDLPAGPLNHHWTKNIIASGDGSKLYASVGSNSNVAENGIDKEEGRAAIWEIERDSGEHRIFASGLRNPNGMAWVSANNTLWTAVNERDEIGNDLVPDYITSVRDGGFYGWPYSYYGQHVDERVQPQNAGLVAKAIPPDYALGSHTASLGLAYSQDNTLPETLHNGMFVGQHGSWNRKPRSGYKVIFIPFTDDMPSGVPIDVLTGFVNDEGDANGRPVGVALDQKGALLVADDVGNVIWRVTESTK